MNRKKAGMLAALMVSASILLCGCNESNAVIKTSDSKGKYEIATVRWADWGDAYHVGFPDEAAKEAGIQLDWNTILNEDWGNRKAVLLAGGDLPDAFMGSICFTEADILTNKDIFIQLDDYIDEYMPNLKSILESDHIMRELATSSDGHIYGLPAKKPCRPVIANQMFINQQWLDNLGLNMPVTYDEFVDVLRAFKEKDANGNGDPDDEIPYGEGFADSTLYFCIPFGVTPGGEGTYNMMVKYGQPVFIQASDEYKNGILAMHKCFEEGLIDPELYTQDDSMRDAKLMNETPVIGCAAGWTADATFGSNADQYVAMPALIGPDGKQYVSSDPEHWNYSRYEFVVTSSCKDPGPLLAWIDKFYTEDASIQNFYGSFGIGVEKDEQTGTYTVLETKDMQADLFAWKYSLRDFGPKYVPDDFNEKVVYEGDNGDASKLILDQSMKQYAQEAFPNVSYTAEQLQVLGTLYPDILTYIGIKQSLWVTEGGIEKEWDNYIDTLNKMGYEEMLHIQESAYDTYEERRDRN